MSEEGGKGNVGAAPQFIDPRVAFASTGSLQTKSKHVWLLITGVIFPVITLVAELWTHMCAQAFFDPIPTWLHVFLVGSVPFFNGLAWLHLHGRCLIPLRLVLIGNASAAVISICYALYYLPLFPLAVIALLFFGWGLLPMAPLFAAAATLQLRALLPKPRPPFAFWPGMALGLALMAAVVVPSQLTVYLADQASSGSYVDRAEAMSWLRKIGSEQALLRQCYPSQDAEIPFVVSLGKKLKPDEAQLIFYRFTGKPFNAVPPPNSHRGRLFADAWSWDPNQGGQSIGRRVKGLSLASSNLDGLIEPDSALAYMEWTLEFKNEAPFDGEARALVALPPGGVVSRLTLWVNGEEREAAFAGSQQTRQAYERVAIRQRCDPVLVTSSGPDQVLMQCFPVPRQGGKMKVRLGITAPLKLCAREEGTLLWPRFVEKNFVNQPGLKHAVVMTSPAPLHSVGASDSLIEDKYRLWGDLPEKMLHDPEHAIRAQRSPQAIHTWSPDSAEPNGAVIHQTVQEKKSEFERLVIVVDGSQTMATLFPRIADALAKVPAHIPMTILVAEDDVVRFDSSETYGRAGAVAKLRARSGQGGQDNVPALLRALDETREHPGCALVWIHGAQPVVFAPIETLKARLDRQPVSFHSVAAVAGANRIVEQLNGSPNFTSAARLGSFKDDLVRLLENLSGERTTLELVRNREFTERPADARASQHLVRLWGREEVKRLTGRGDLSRAIELAARLQLVTAVSGAVVLENKQQYEDSGLTPIDPKTAPSVPEPEHIGLLVLAAVGWLLWRKARSAGTSGSRAVV